MDGEDAGPQVQHAVVVHQSQHKAIVRGKQPKACVEQRTMAATASRLACDESSTALTVLVTFGDDGEDGSVDDTEDIALFHVSIGWPEEHICGAPLEHEGCETQTKEGGTEERVRQGSRARLRTPWREKGRQKQEVRTKDSEKVHQVPALHQHDHSVLERERILLVGARVVLQDL